MNSDKGRQLIKFLVALMEKVERVEKLEPPAATFLVPTTFAEALRLAADKAEENEKLKLEVREAVAEVQVSSTKADQLMSVRAAEDVSIPLSVWLGRTSSEHGHGPVNGLKALRALGVLHREIVKGCRRSKESAMTMAGIRMPPGMFMPPSWFMVHGSWFMVHGSGFMVHGSWFLVITGMDGSIHSVFDAREGGSEREW